MKNNIRDRLTWLVEGNVTIFANTAKENFDATVRLDRLLISFAFCDEIVRIAVKDMDVLWLNVDYKEMTSD